MRVILISSMNIVLRIHAVNVVDVIARALGEDPSVLVCVVGQTASGKTALATEVAARVGGEIVTADSVQIYRELDIGSGKPTAEERARAPHHLVSALDPMSPCDASRFVALADAVIADVRARGRVPIVCGGTFLWVKALVQGLVPAPAASESARDAHRKIVETSGRDALHAALEKVDPVAAAKLHPNDVVRVSRALEVFETTGEKISDLHAAHGFSDVRHKAKLFAIERTPEDLRARIEKRVDGFLAAGWIDEVRDLVLRGRGEARGMGSVGYREVAAHLRGEVAAADLKTAVVRSTRIFARRQRTWLGREPVTWLPQR
jgi:tRNA dimethylallyltransferase